MKIGDRVQTPDGCGVIVRIVEWFGSCAVEVEYDRLTGFNSGQRVVRTYAADDVEVVPFEVTTYAICSECSPDRARAVAQYMNERGFKDVVYGGEGHVPEAGIAWPAEYAQAFENACQRIGGGR